MPKGPHTYSAPAAACAVDVLAELARRAEPATLADLARSLEHSKSLIYRTLIELERTEFVSRDAQSRYRIGILAFEVGVAYLTNSPLEVTIQEALQSLARESGESTNLGVLRGKDVLYLMKFDGISSYITISRVGGRVPATCVANGKALLAALPPEQVRRMVPEPLTMMTPHSCRSLADLEQDLAVVRERGYARDDNEAVVGRVGLAVTIPYPSDPSGLAAISLSLDASEADGKADADLLDLLMKTRTRIHREVQTRNALPQ